MVDTFVGVGQALRQVAHDERLSGTVTFLFTDVEGSTALLKRLGRERYGGLLAEQQGVLRDAFAAHRGEEIDTQGDSFFVAFRSASDAVAAAVAIQRTLADHEWPDGVHVRVRVGIHSGEAAAAGERYVGFSVHRAARIGEAAHGGQVLVSDATRALVEDDLLEGISLLDLGWYRLKDVDRPERISQVVAAGLESRFPPPRGAGLVDAPVLRRRSLLAAVLAGVIAAAVAVPVFALGEGRSSASEVKIASNSLAAIDPKTNKVVADISVGRRPVAIAVGGGAVWVANGGDQTVDRIDPRTGKVVASIGVGKDVSDIAIGFGSVWVADGSDEALTRIDPTQNAVESTLTFGAPNQLAPAPIYNVTIGDGAVWATRGNTILRIDPRTDQIARTIRIATPTGVAVGNGDVWVTTATDRLLRIDSGTGVETLSRSLTDVPSLPILGGSALWTVVTLGFSRAQVTRIDPDTGFQTGSVTMGPDSFPSGLAWGGNAIWATGQGGTVLRIDPSAVQTRARIRLGHATTGVAVGEGRVWVAVATTN